MNWLLIIVIALWAFYIIRGYKKGMLRMLFSLISWLVILILSALATPHVSDFLEKNTTIAKDIEVSSKARLKEMVTESNGKTNNNQKLLEMLGADIPEELLTAIIGDGNVADELLESTGLYEQISQKISSLVLKGISFIICIVIAAVISCIIRGMIHIIEDVPIIGFVNRILGVMLGSLKTLIIVWLFFAIVTMNVMTEFGTMMTSYIYESTFLKWMYENNLLLIILLKSL